MRLLVTGAISQRLVFEPALYPELASKLVTLDDSSLS